MNAQGGPAEACRAKADASADSAEEMKDTPGVSPGRLHVSLLHMRILQKHWVGTGEWNA
jgi:hypothetical protein